MVVNVIVLKVVIIIANNKRLIKEVLPLEYTEIVLLYQFMAENTGAIALLCQGHMMYTDTHAHQPNPH